MGPLLATRDGDARDLSSIRASVRSMQSFPLGRYIFQVCPITYITVEEFIVMDLLRRTVSYNDCHGEGAGISVNKYCDTEIINNHIHDNVATPSGGTGGGEKTSRGGGIRITTTDIEVEGNKINNNTATKGGGVYIRNYEEVDYVVNLDNNEIYSNSAESGGGVYCYEGGDNCTFENNLIKDNAVDSIPHYLDEYNGGGIYCKDTVVDMINNTICDNEAVDYGGGICCAMTIMPVINNSIIWGNTAGVAGDQIAHPYSYEPTLNYCCIEDGWTGSGGNNISDDPLFVEAPSGGTRYLSQEDAGQSVDSPCMDAGNGSMITGTTRTDYEQDVSTVDMGYHYPLQ